MGSIHTVCKRSDNLWPVHKDGDEPNPHAATIVSYDLMPALLSNTASPASASASASSASTASTASAVRLLSRLFGIVICDESHLLKSPDALRTLTLLPLLRACRRLLLLSGTPALARPAELWTQLHAIDSSAATGFPDFEQYARRYCADDSGSRGAAAGAHRGARLLKELHARLDGRLMLLSMHEGCGGELEGPGL